MRGVHDLLMAPICQSQEGIKVPQLVIFNLFGHKGAWELGRAQSSAVTNIGEY